MEKYKNKQMKMEKRKRSNLVKESTYGLMEENIMESGNKILKMVKANLCMLMELFIMVIG